MRCCAITLASGIIFMLPPNDAFKVTDGVIAAIAGAFSNSAVGRVLDLLRR